MLEPDPDVRELIVRILEDGGWDVAADPGAADAIVVDPAYAELLGEAEALKRARPGLRIVCLSIAPPEPHVVHVLEPVAYIQKPFHRTDLTAALEGVVERRS